MVVAPKELRCRFVAIFRIWVDVQGILQLLMRVNTKASWPVLNLLGAENWDQIYSEAVDGKAEQRVAPDRAAFAWHASVVANREVAAPA